MIVAGGAGFIGANFVRNVVSTTNGSVVVVKLTYAGNFANLEALSGERVDVVVGDICDGGLVNSVASSADLIVNFTAESHNDRSLHVTKLFLKTNVEGTFVLLEAARRFGIRYHHVSTDKVYGASQSPQTRHLLWIAGTVRLAPIRQLKPLQITL